MLLAARRGLFLFARAAQPLSSSSHSLLSPARRQMITVTGHLAPDTDAVCAALVRASHLQRLQGVEARAVRLGPLNGETACVLEMLGIDVPPLLEEAELQTLPEASVAIVDTNNADELLKGLKGSQLHSIVDHHKLVGNLATPAPIDIDIRPLCSTGSVLFQRLKAMNEHPSTTEAGLMLACILSDSLGFRSPTTTELDKTMAAELAEIAGLDMIDMTEKMLAAKSNVSAVDDSTLVLLDSKQYNFGLGPFRVSVIETTDAAPLVARRLGLVKAANEVAHAQGLSGVLVFVVDILEESAIFLNEDLKLRRRIAAEFKQPLPTGGKEPLRLPGILSRKKQIVPALERALSTTFVDEA